MEEQPNNKESHEKITLAYRTMKKVAKRRSVRIYKMGTRIKRRNLAEMSTNLRCLRNKGKVYETFRWPAGITKLFHHHVTRYQTKREILEGPFIRQL
jgi:hypothetical protein